MEGVQITSPRHGVIVLEWDKSVSCSGKIWVTEPVLGGPPQRAAPQISQLMSPKFWKGEAQRDGVLFPNDSHTGPISQQPGGHRVAGTSSCTWRPQAVSCRERVTSVQGRQRCLCLDFQAPVALKCSIPGVTNQQGLPTPLRTQWVPWTPCHIHLPILNCMNHRDWEPVEVHWCRTETRKEGGGRRSKGLFYPPTSTDST